MFSRLDRIPQRDGQTEFLTNIVLCTISRADACDNTYHINKPCLLQIACLTAVKHVILTGLEISNMFIFLDLLFRLLLLLLLRLMMLKMG